MTDLVTMYPRWAQKLAHGIRARLGNSFVLHGNVRDLAPWKRNGSTEFLPLQRFLREALIPRITPVSPELVLCFIAERTLGLPKSY